MSVWRLFSFGAGVASDGTVKLQEVQGYQGYR